MIGLVLAALLAITPVVPVATPTEPPMIQVTPPTDSFDIYLVIWPDKDHYHIATLGEYQKALPKCKKFNVAMFDQEDGGVMIAFNCYL